ncbi:hypothetical protein SAMN04487998_1008 [Hymenobacter actinosclerus]|uniref:Uncharacterized protein n=1 Tax=Hymenobacter actinosclerus TaxID=82805 RepID=A0A1I0BC65_9BACT|nr:hypothetical protein SAMN04487998_1008 [Hymenobacter actinosclerus]
MKKGFYQVVEPFLYRAKQAYDRYTEKLSPQPQVREALGLSK